MNRGQLVAAAIVMGIGLPLVFVYARAMADGVRRAREAPLRAMFGDRIYERLLAGERTPMHYLGDDRLAPDFELRDRHGRPFRLSEQRGKTVVMNFWSITCPPCVEEMPTLVELADILAERDDVVLVAVSTDAGWDEVAHLFPPDSRLRVIFDPDRAVTRGRYGTRLLPETWIVDREGVIRFRYDGARDWSSPLAIDVIDMFAR
ncbi:MAG: TlpA family protein disulfide reductase [Myxococcota bacterium]|nr:TlpA family protein disulfide reductase [Myxococcota bacterium]